MRKVLYRLVTGKLGEDPVPLEVQAEYERGVVQVLKEAGLEPIISHRIPAKRLSAGD